MQRKSAGKYVLRTDEFAAGNYEEIRAMHVADFLLSCSPGDSPMQKEPVNLKKCLFIRLQAITQYPFGSTKHLKIHKV